MRLRKAALFVFVIGSLAHPLRANAKSVTLEWAQVEGATAYEVQILQPEGNSALGKKAYRIEDPSWRGDLNPGVYAYQIRAFDKLKRPGLWSDPQPLAVMPGAPKPEQPEDGAKLQLFHPEARTVLKWKGVQGVSEYRLEVERDGNAHFNNVVTGNQADLGVLPPGSYTWKISSVLKPSKRSPASVQGRSWMGEPSDENNFRVERTALERPEILHPRGMFPPGPGGELLFTWKAVSGADLYEVRFVRAPQNGSPEAISAILMKAKTAHAKGDSIKLRVPEGHYVWQVRALASLPGGSATEAPHAGPESQSKFQINPNAVFTSGSGYVALSTMLAPYTYEIVSPSAGHKGAISSTAMTVRASGEYWPWAQWGLSAAAETTNFTLNRQNFSRLAAELTAKYQANISRDRFGWFLAPKAGLEARQYIAIVPEFSAGSDVPVGTQSYSLLALGTSVGLDIRKQFSDGWSLGGKLAYFVPLALAGARSGAITGEASYRNLSFGIQGLYWIKKDVGLSAGTYLEKRSLSYKPAGASESEKLFMDGSYFFGSLIYRFGGK